MDDRVAVRMSWGSWLRNFVDGDDVLHCLHEIEAGLLVDDFLPSFARELAARHCGFEHLRAERHFTTTMFSTVLQSMDLSKEASIFANSSVMADLVAFGMATVAAGLIKCFSAKALA